MPSILRDAVITSNRLTARANLPRRPTGFRGSCLLLMLFHLLRGVGLLRRSEHRKRPSCCRGCRKICGGFVAFGITRICRSRANVSLTLGHKALQFRQLPQPGIGSRQPVRESRPLRSPKLLLSASPNSSVRSALPFHSGASLVAVFVAFCSGKLLRDRLQAGGLRPCTRQGFVGTSLGRGER
jgi:hypothetical protein